MKETIVKQVKDFKYGETVKVKETIKEIRVYNDLYRNDNGKLNLIQNDEFNTLISEKLLVDTYEEKSYELTRFDMTFNISESSFRELHILYNVCINESMDDLFITLIHKGAVQDLNLESDNKEFRNNNFIETCAKYYRIALPVDNFDTAFWQLVTNLRTINNKDLISKENLTNKNYRISDIIECDSMSSLVNDLYNAYVNTMEKGE